MELTGTSNTEGPAPDCAEHNGPVLKIRIKEGDGLRMSMCVLQSSLGLYPWVGGQFPRYETTEPDAIYRCVEPSAFGPTLVVGDTLYLGSEGSDSSRWMNIDLRHGNYKTCTESIVALLLGLVTETANRYAEYFNDHVVHAPAVPVLYAYSKMESEGVYSFYIACMAMMPVDYEARQLRLRSAE